MSKSQIEDLINSATDKKQPLYLRKGWIVVARSLLTDADKELRKLEKSIKKELEG